jgi:ATP-dependent Clp protease ATP-binding subunit ClpA/ActR/RegA family two-component response regulator
MENPASHPKSSHDDTINSLVEYLCRKVVGQPAALNHIVPYVQMHQAGLSPVGRPVGVFLLLGPSGTGKTKTVEALAEILHGNERKMVRLDCGEFQMEHEVAKIIGAPPGYTGHRETQTALTQQRLTEATSEGCNISIVLFDEIEKAAPSVTRLLLGILDKAQLRLGDNTEVNFERSLIFFTSNLGAREMLKELNPGMGFQAEGPPPMSDLMGKLETIALASVRKMFSPEFVNRIDAVITYQPLDKQSFDLILDNLIRDLQDHVNSQLSSKCFNIEIPAESRDFLLKKGTSPEYGARELKRTMHRYVTQPLATMVLQGKIGAGAHVSATVFEDQERLHFTVMKGVKTAIPSAMTLIIVDDNEALLYLLSEQLQKHAEWRILLAGSVAEAEKKIAAHPPDVALLDVMLPDGDGVKLGVNLKLRFPKVGAIMMTGSDLTQEDYEICKQYRFPIIMKPFLTDQIVSMIRSNLKPAAVAGRSEEKRESKST